MAKDHETLLSKINSGRARVAVIGLGYVGLPLAVEFAKAGFSTSGIDIDNRKFDELNAGRSYVIDVPQNDFAELIPSGKLKPKIFATPTPSAFPSARKISPEGSRLSRRFSTT